MSDEQQATGPQTFDCTVRVCKPCVELQGQECHTPDCIFFLRSMAEVKHYLDVMLLCPVIQHMNGDEERIVLVPPESSKQVDAEAVAKEIVTVHESLYGEVKDSLELVEEIAAALTSAQQRSNQQ